MICNRCNENQTVHLVEYKDSFFPEEICEHCFDKDCELIDMVIDPLAQEITL